MAWFQDLSPCTYFGDDLAGCLNAVGWLERGQAFPTGAVDPAVYARLVELLTDPWEPVASAGLHTCDLCLYDGSHGVKNLFLPAARRAFVAPELIAHYMNAHGYRPPQEFCDAVLACPPMRSKAYLMAILVSARPIVTKVRDRMFWG